MRKHDCGSDVFLSSSKPVFFTTMLCVMVALVRSILWTSLCSFQPMVAVIMAMKVNTATETSLFSDLLENISSRQLTWHILNFTTVPPSLHPSMQPVMM